MKYSINFKDPPFPFPDFKSNNVLAFSGRVAYKYSTAAFACCLCSDVIFLASYKPSMEVLVHFKFYNISIPATTFPFCLYTSVIIVFSVFPNVETLSLRRFCTFSNPIPFSTI